jgi:hypothetical protein
MDFTYVSLSVSCKVNCSNLFLVNIFEKKNIILLSHVYRLNFLMCGITLTDSDLSETGFTDVLPLLAVRLLLWVFHAQLLATVLVKN